MVSISGCDPLDPGSTPIILGSGDNEIDKEPVSADLENTGLSSPIANCVRLIT